ncbi:MAG: hypothetical protein AAB615_02395 [Patescibacteria group bacterium]
MSETAKNISSHASGASGGGIYFFAFIGALIYFLQQATTFGEGVIGLLKAIVWPAILIYKLFGFLGL